MKGGIYIVKCLYCGELFDNKKELYVKPNSRRYAHANCYLREKVKNPALVELTIFDPADEVTCIYCKKKFFKSKIDNYKILDNGKYAHVECCEIEAKRELTDKEKLDNLIIQLYELKFVSPRVQKQINDYITKYDYTYTGIKKTLEYMHFVKKLPVDKAAFDTYGIGLVKSYFDQAKRYYKAIWEAQQSQKESLNGYSIADFVPQPIEISIPAPRRKELKRQLFTFLEEGQDGI